MKQILTVFSFLFISCMLVAQPRQYTVANIHAHNDYEHNIPFSDAYALGIGSIEADVHWIRDTLFVAHGSKELRPDVLFQSAYLQKLNDAVKVNNEHPYADGKRFLQLLIDIKTDSLQTLKEVIREIELFPALVNNPMVHFVITGNQPNPKDFDTYPSWLLFDGKINQPDHLRQIGRIGLFSANFSLYSKWKGMGEIPETDLPAIKASIEKAHLLHKAFRFWGVPDNPNVWAIMKQLGVDYINTDHIAEAADFVTVR